MPTISDILSQAANTPVSNPVATDPKRSSVLDAMARIKASIPSAIPTVDNYSVAAGQGTSKGAFTMGEEEADLRNMSRPQLFLKYGSRAADMISGVANAQAQYNDDITAQQTTDNVIGDVSSGILSGAANSVAGIAALGTGLINEEAGAAIADVIGNMNERVQAGQSDALNAARRAAAARRGLETRDNAAIYERDKEAAPVEAAMRRIGTEAVQSVIDTIKDPTLLSDGAANAVGSLATAGPMGKAFKAVGATILEGTGILGITRGGALGASAAIKAAAVGEALVMPAAIGSMEAGGAYQQTVDEALKRGATPEEANKAGLEAAAIAGPVGAATGAIVGKFEANPLQVKSLGSSLLNTFLKEPVEEGIQGAAGQFAQNKGIQDQVDPNQSLTEGVGEGAGQGALFGLGAAGIVQAPGAAGRAAVVAGTTTYKAAKAGFDATVGKLMARGEAVMAENEAAAPSNPDFVVNEAGEAMAMAPEETAIVEDVIAGSAGTTEEKTEASEYVKTLMGSLSLDETDVSDVAALGNDPELGDIVGSSQSRIEAIRRVADVVSQATEPNDKIAAKAYLFKQVETLMELTKKDPALLAQIEDDTDANRVLAKYNSVLSAVLNMPNVLDSVRMIKAAYAQADQTEAAPIQSEQDVDAIQDTILNAQLNPDPLKGNLENTEWVLFQAQKGKLDLTNAQRESLQGAVTMLRAAKQSAADAEAVGLTAQDIVTKQILTENGKAKGDKRPQSALEHYKGIYDAKASGDLEGATAALSDFGLFVQHMQNKVEAINRHFTDGDPNAARVPYSMLTNDAQRSWKPSPKGMFIRPDDIKSVGIAKQIALEADSLFKIYTGLRGALSDLSVQDVVPVSLDPALDGKVEEVVARFSKEATQQNTPAKDKVPTVEPKVEEATQLPSEPVVNKKEEPGEQATVEEKAKPEPKSEEPETKPVEKQQVEEPASEVIEPEEEQASPVADQRTRPYKKMGGEYINDPDAMQLDEMSEDEVLQMFAKRIVAKDLAHLTDNQSAGVIDYKGRIWELNSSTNTNGDHAEFFEALTTATRNLRAGEDYMRITGYGKSLAIGAAFGTYEANEKQNATIRAVEAIAKRNGIKFIGPNGNVNIEAELVSEDPTVKLVGIDAVYPSLLGSDGSIKNWFKAAFRLPKAAKTQIVNEQAPFSFIRDIFENAKTLGDHLGTKLTNDFNPYMAAAYDRYFTLGDQIGQQLEYNLKMFLKGNDVGQRFLDGKDAVHTWRDGKLINLTEMQDGEMVYNQRLLGLAVLAGLQWKLDAPNIGSKWDSKDLADHLGMEEAFVTDTMLNALNVGMTKDEALNSLARKIQAYWDLETDNSVVDGYTKGLPLGMAAEVFRAFNQQGLFDQKEIIFRDDNLPIRKKKITILKFIPKKDKDSDVLAAASSLIEKSVMLDPELQFYMGDDLPPIRGTQMHSSVKIKAKEKSALKLEQKQVHNIDMTMLSVYEALDLDSFMELFGAGDLSDRKLNENHKQSLDGRNLSAKMSFEQIQRVMFAARNTAKAAGLELGDLPIRYAYEIASNGRMQMRGRNNPQADKAMREVILPTSSTLDLSGNGQGYEAFSLALAQALGVKIHQETRESSIQKVNEKLRGPLAPAVTMLREWLTNPDQFTPEQVAVLKAADLTAVGLHALVDYAKYENASADERKAFETKLYIEADGVSNGVVNAMMLMTPGKFSEQQVQNVAKGGVFIGSKSTLNKHRTQTDSVDLYKAVTALLPGKLGIVRDQLDKFGNDQMDRLLDLIGLLLPDLTFDPETKQLTLERGIAKNPMTITMYGSGAKGIAGNITKELIAALYERMSDVANRPAGMEEHEAMFPGDIDSKTKYARLTNAYNSLWQYTPTTKLKLYKTKAVEENNDGFNPETYTVSKSQLEAIQNNVHRLFVNPMREAVDEVIGKDLLRSLTAMRKAIQVQSIVLEHAFNEKIADAVQAKVDADPTYRKSDFLSQDEQEAILDSLKDIAPLVITEAHDYLITNSSRISLNADEAETGIAGSLDGKLRIGAPVRGPTDSGVSAMPLLTQGFGDASMMMLLANMGLEGTLKIFDGMHMPLDKIDEYGEKSNQAVFETWKENPIREVLKTFDHFLKNVDFFQYGSEELEEKLYKQLFSFDDIEMGIDTKGIQKGMEYLRAELSGYADSIDARRRAIAEVGMSVDQMAAVGSSYGSSQDLPVGDVDISEVVQRLNAVIDTPVEVIGFDQEVEGPTVVAEPSPIEQVGRAHPTGVRVLSFTAVKNLGRLVKMTAAQRVMFGELVRSNAIKDYKVVHGTVEQIRAYQRAAGRSDIDLAGKSGAASIGERTIYLISPSTETLVHELIHAGSFETIVNHYEGQDLGPNKVAIQEAISRMEEQMKLFMEMDVTALKVDAQLAFEKARAGILDAQSSVDDTQAVAQAKALNEFMAWTLANQEIAEALETKSHPLVQLVKDVAKWIKQLIWGRKKAPAVNESFLSNLQFNAGVVIRSQPTLGRIFRDTALFQNQAYGINDRLVRLNQEFAQRIADFLRTNDAALLKAGIMPEAQVRYATKASVNMLKSVAKNGFPMRSALEASTFKLILATMMTEAEIDPASMVKMQDLYAHTVKHLSVESFMADPQSTEAGVRELAAMKYDSIVGRKRIEIDSQGRSSLLPTFMALASVSEEFREVLRKLPVPKPDKIKGKTFDDILTNAANSVMDTVANRVSGQNNAPNVQRALDNLADQIADVAQDRQNFMEKLDSKGSSFIDGLNDKVVDLMGKASGYLVEQGEKLDAAATSKPAQFLAKSLTLTGAIISEKNGAKVAEGVIKTMNLLNAPEVLHKFMVDMVGRTASNAAIFDMIKTVRSYIQQNRQRYREHLPEFIAQSYTRKLTDAEWEHLYKVMGKADVAALRQSFSIKDILTMLEDETSLDAAIAKLQTEVAKEVGTVHKYTDVDWKAQQLAKYMNTGEVGNTLQRNAYAIAKINVANPSDALMKSLDQLISLYALKSAPKDSRDAVSSLVQDETEGLSFTLNYLVGQRAEEQRKVQTSSAAQMNHYKGYIPVERQMGAAFLVADDTEYAKLIERSFIRVADYEGSSAERFATKKGYYYNPVSGRASYEQGILQNVRQTASGVDIVTGFSEGQHTAGRITGPKGVAFAERRMSQEKGKEPLMPVYDENGSVVAYERSMDPVQAERIATQNNLSKVIGQWRGRQVEESMSQTFNEALITQLKVMYDEDVKKGTMDPKEYVDLLDAKTLKDQPILADAVKLFTPDTRDFIEATFGKKFFVRRDMVIDAVGYRSASVGDIWTGNTNWSEDTINLAKKLALGVFGNDAYKHVLMAEKTVQNFVSDARVLIVVKSVIVPVANMVSNTLQLVARGVPLQDIVKGVPRKTVEIDGYIKSTHRMIQAEAELLAAEGNIYAQNKLKTEIQSILDSHKRLSIWPLIQAGEFSSISDVGQVIEQEDFTSGKLGAYIEGLVDKLPPSIRNAGRYGLITKDTALFQGLQRAVQYGDFLAKAVLYDELTKRKGKSSEYALARITEEYVNYDRLSGRTRGYLENMGLLWFYNFKIRSAKVAVSMIRNNPVHSLIAMMVPVPEIFGSVGTPLSDNIVAKAADGGLQWSTGLGMGIRAPLMNPFINAFL